jgi:hypothetical protein
MENNIKNLFKVSTLSELLRNYENSKMPIKGGPIVLINTYYGLLKNLLNTFYFENLKPYEDDTHSGQDYDIVGYEKITSNNPFKRLMRKPIRGEKKIILSKIHYLDNRGFIYFTTTNYNNDIEVQIDADLILYTTGFSSLEKIKQYGMYDELLNIFTIWIKNNYNVNLDSISFQEGINQELEKENIKVLPLPSSIIKNFGGYFNYKITESLKNVNELRENRKKIIKITETDLIKIVKKVIIEQTDKQNLDKKIIYYINRYANETPKEPNDDIFKWSAKIFNKLSVRFENEKKGEDLSYYMRNNFDEYVFKLYGASQSEIDEILKSKKAYETLEKMVLSGANQSEINDFLRDFF